MKAARFYDKGDIRVDEVSEPKPKGDEVVVEIEWGGICGTDLHEYTVSPRVIPSSDKRGRHPLTGEVLPVTLCHEFCGRITGSVPNGLKGSGGATLKEGMAVIIDPRQYCQACSLCRQQATNQCAKWGFLGLTGGGGGFAERCAVRADMCYPLPDSVKLENAALIEPLAVGRHALTMSGMTDWKGVSVLIVGGGPVGLAVLFNLKAAVSDVGREVFNPLDVRVPQECRKLTNGERVDVVFDCAGITPGMCDGMGALRLRGTYVGVAYWETAFVLPMEYFMFKELTVKTSTAYDDGDFGNTVRDFVAGKFLGAEKMVTARIALENVKEKGFEPLLKYKDDHVKILVTPKRKLLSLL